MKEIKIKTIDSMSQLIEELNNKQNNDYFFRGMPNYSWRLRTSIDRELEVINIETDKKLFCGQKSNICHELIYQSKFIDENETKYKKLYGIPFSQNVKIDEYNFLKLQVSVQHFGGKTRLLDWTKNWKKALYFCLEDKKQEGDTAVWCIRKHCLPDVEECLKNPSYLIPDVLDDENNDNIINNYYRRLKWGVYLLNTHKDEQYKNIQRVQNQEGVLLVSAPGDYFDFETQLKESEWINDGDVIKYKISKSLRKDIRKLLEHYGITENFMYHKDFNQLNCDTEIRQETKKWG